MDEQIIKRSNAWLEGNFDEETKTEVRKLQQENGNELADAFYRNLEFGTGGLRGIMGVGTNRMNKYTVGMATQGYANYLKQTYPGGIVRVAIAHDSRNNSRLFAEIVANVMAANGIKVFLFEALRPTPELSFTIRHLGCQGGVVCTASHNPKEYNWYKAYWSDGGQLVPPHDKNVIKEVDKVLSVDDVKWKGGENNITIIGKDVDEEYIKMVKTLSVYPEIIQKQKDLKIVYTPIHGTGITLMPQVLDRFGFKNVTIVQEQSIPDGNFPTVVSPNPEEKDAMNIALNKAKEIDADILLGTDPDADRVGIGVKDKSGNWVLMNGNQTAVLAFNYMIEARKAKQAGDSPPAAPAAEAAPPPVSSAPVTPAPPPAPASVAPPPRRRRSAPRPPVLPELDDDEAITRDQTQDLPRLRQIDVDTQPATNASHPLDPTGSEE